MSDDFEGFLRELAERGHEPLLAKVTGSARFDVVDGDRTVRWLLDIDSGDVTVSHKTGRPACAIRGDKRLLDEVASGRKNAMAAVLRGALVCSGDVELLFAIQRIFPGPPRDPRSDRVGSRRGGAA